jgi:hypothetical protein
MVPPRRVCFASCLHVMDQCNTVLYSPVLYSRIRPRSLGVGIYGKTKDDNGDGVLTWRPRTVEDFPQLKYNY